MVVSRPLPGLKQGSSISIRSTLANHHQQQTCTTHIDIRSQWRDDGELSLLQYLPQGLGKEDKQPSSLSLSFSQAPDQLTSLGREESHFRLDLNDDTPKESPKEIKPIFSIDMSKALDNDDTASANDDDDDDTLMSSEGTILSLTVPEKINIDCDLIHGGSITIHNKVEGDICLRTTNGDIVVNKLRGHSIDIEALGKGNTIFSLSLIHI